MDQFLKGEVVTLVWTLKNSSGSLVDNLSQTFKFIDPTSTQAQVSYTDGTTGIIHDSLGNYHFDLIASLAGTWWVRVETGPPNQGAQEYRFEVRATRFV